MPISIARLVLAGGRSAPNALAVAASPPCDTGSDREAAGDDISSLVVDAALFSASTAGSVAAAPAASVGTATDRERARGWWRRGWRSPVRAGIFTSPVSTFARIFDCLLVCCLAITVFLLDRHRTIAMLAPPQARRLGQAGRQLRRGPTTWTAMLPMRRKSSGIVAAKDFLLDCSAVVLQAASNAPQNRLTRAMSERPERPCRGS